MDTQTSLFLLVTAATLVAAVLRWPGEADIYIELWRRFWGERQGAECHDEVVLLQQAVEYRLSATEWRPGHAWQTKGPSKAVKTSRELLPENRSLVRTPTTQVAMLEERRTHGLRTPPTNLTDSVDNTPLNRFMAHGGADTIASELPQPVGNAPAQMGPVFCVYLTYTGGSGPSKPAKSKDEILKLLIGPGPSWAGVVKFSSWVNPL